MSERNRCLFGCVLGVVAIGLLFLRPGAPWLWCLAFCLSGVLTAERATRSESVKDVTGPALAAAFIGIVLVFALLLAPSSLWNSLSNFLADIPVPNPPNDSALRAAAPWWVRVSLAAFWVAITWRRYMRMRRQTSVAAA